MNSNLGKEKKYLIYQITNLINGKIYVGAHITYNINDKYMGSSKYLKKDIKELGRQNFEKIPLHVFDNKEDMRLKEAEIVDKNFVFRNDTYNRLVGGIMDFSWVGTVVVKDKDGNCQRVYVEDPRYLSGELIHVCTGIKNENAKIANINTVVVKKNNKFFRISKNDSEWLSGELVPYNKGIKQHPNSIFKNKKRSDVFKNKLSEAAKLKIGNKNSQFGSCWITKGKENKKIRREK